jgi:hypothetical protein
MTIRDVYAVYQSIMKMLKHAVWQRIKNLVTRWQRTRMVATKEAMLVTTMYKIDTFNQTIY